MGFQELKRKKSEDASRPRGHRSKRGTPLKPKKEKKNGRQKKNTKPGKRPSKAKEVKRWCTRKKRVDPSWKKQSKAASGSNKQAGSYVDQQRKKQNFGAHHQKKLEND